MKEELHPLIMKEELHPLMVLTWSYVYPGVVTADELPDEAGLARAVLAQQQDLGLGAQLGGQDLGRVELVEEELLLDGQQAVLVQAGELLHHRVVALLHLLRLRGHHSDQPLIAASGCWTTSGCWRTSGCSGQSSASSYFKAK